MTERILPPSQSRALATILYIVYGFIGLGIVALAGVFLGPMRGTHVHPHG